MEHYSGTSKRKRGWMAVVLALACALVLPAAEAACTSDSITASPYKVEFASSSGSRFCFSVTNSRSCNTATTCCLQPAYKLKTVTMKGVSSSCTSTTQKKAMLWSTGGSFKRVKFVGSDIQFAVTGATQICLDLSAVTGCTTMDTLCGGKTCQFSVVSAVFKRTSKVQCCLASSVSLQPCSISNGGCSPKATCVNSESTGTRTCTCKTGYTGNGITCTDVNECLTNNGGCSQYATCTNTDGGRTCTCKPGYTGNGLVCTDINECATNNGGCSANAICTNIGGGKTCTCKPGYTGNGITCTDINECATNNGGCSQYATCTNTPGSFTCACKPGYNGNGFVCSADVNACSTGNGGCSAFATCSPTQSGGVICTCITGFQGDGQTCTDIDECATNNGGCSQFATCQNTVGSRVCTCNAGYTGNGITCKGFNIQLINVGTDTSQDAVFDTARQRWENTIIMDVPDIPLGTTDLTAGRINGGAYKFYGPIDDIVIFYSFYNIDGPGGALGRTELIYTRTGTGLPMTALMVFDSSDYGPGKPYSQAVFNTVVLHEMGHALGFGSLWEKRGLVTGCVPLSNNPAYFTGTNAKREWTAAGCGPMPQVETSLAVGSSCNHWPEATLKRELMTPKVFDQGLNPLSRITIASMEDLYGPGSVDYAGADPFSCLSAAAAAAGVNASGVVFAEATNVDGELINPFSNMEERPFLELDVAPASSEQQQQQPTSATSVGSAAAVSVDTPNTSSASSTSHSGATFLPAAAVTAASPLFLPMAPSSSSEPLNG